MNRIEEIRAHLAQVKERQKELDAQYAGEVFPREAQEEFEALRAEQDEAEKAIAHLEERQSVIEALADNPENVEDEKRYVLAPRGKRVSSRVPDDPTKIEEYRNHAGSMDELDQAYRDGARKILESRYRPSDSRVSREEAQNDVDGLIGLDREVAIRMIATSSDKYKAEFRDYLQHGVVGPEMVRASSLTTTAGGFAVPVELDTTLLITNAGRVNPVRRLADVRQTAGNVVEFINTAGITAGYGAEVTEASDNAPVLAQPTANVEKAFAFVPFSIEIGSDWANFQSDMARAFTDAKDDLEATKFLKGLGHGSNEPQGLIAVGGATAIVSTGTTAVVGAQDLYNLRQALSERYQPNAAIVGNRATFDKIRQLDTAGGANLWVQLSYDNPPTLLGYPAYMWSKYDNSPTTSGSTVLTIGDFSYFKIIDRAGMSVELIPHMFATANNRPSGQRGLYMWWRNTSQVVSPVTPSSYSAFQSLKVL
jgi:HK97 family phage major capsid protein